jgi:hypothetical protein
MARMTVTDDEYDLLTEEERIGLKEYQAEFEAEQAAEAAEIEAAANGDPEEAEKPAKAPPPEDDEEDAGDDDTADEEEDDPIDTEEEAEESAAEEVEGETGAVDEPQPLAEALAQVSVPTTMPRLSEAEEKRLVTIKTELKALAQKFDDGELTAVEWRDEQEKLEDERDVLKEKRAVAAMTTQNSVNVWYQTTIPTFIAHHPEYKDGSLRHKLLDTIVRELQMATTTPTDPKILVKAHERITEELGPVAGGEAAPAKKKKGNGKDRTSPPKFADIPASDAQQVTQPNKFARLDKLQGVDYERALAKLTPADRDFYLQGGG